MDIIEEGFLQEQWKMQLISDAIIERDINNGRSTFILLREDRTIVWEVCGYMEVLDHGVPGEACRLVEFFLTEKYNRTVSEDWSSALRLDYENRLFSHLPEIIAAAIIISVRYYHTRVISTEHMQHKLVQSGNIVPLHRIVRAEEKILQNLTFPMPLWSSVQAAEWLALDVGIPVNVFNFLNLVMNIAEVWRDVATRDLQASLVAVTGSDQGPILTIHLAAAVVYSVAQHVQCRSPTMLPALASATNAPNIYIHLLSNLIDYYIQCEGYE